MSEEELWNKFSDLYLHIHNEIMRDHPCSTRSQLYESIAPKNHFVALKLNTPSWNIISDKGWEALVKLDEKFASIMVLYI